MVLPITFENNCVGEKILVNVEKFTDMQVHVGRYMWVGTQLPWKLTHQLHKHCVNVKISKNKF
jgi:hypothetical protein